MTLEVREDRPVPVDGGCPVCREEVALFREEDRPPRAAGKDVSADEAIDAAVRILGEARSPFVYGLSRSSSSTARRAVRLAESIGGAIDVEGSDRIQADLVALHTFGLPSATFGEIRDRADLLLLWRCDPRRSHPGIFAERARPVLLVPPAGSEGAEADRILAVAAGADLDAALALRAHVNGATLQGGSPGGVQDDLLGEAASMLRRARYSAILWDPAATSSVSGVAIASTLTLLARDLNAAARSAARPLGAGGNVAGAIAALAAATGYPRAIGFANGTPRFAPGEFDAARMIGGGHADALLLVGARSVDEASGDRGARGSVVIGPRLPEGMGDPDVWIPTATPGLSAPGTAARADGVTVVLKALVPSRLPTEDDVLDRLLERLVARSRSGGGAARGPRALRQARSASRRG
jgi:formylmethanofuran dehydrogenase subunit B